MNPVRTRHRFASCLLLAGAPLSALAATWHVRPSGNDTTGTASSAAPWRTIAQGIAGMSGGDTRRLHGGTYDEYNLLLEKSGAAAQPTTIMAAPASP